MKQIGCTLLSAAFLLLPSPAAETPLPYQQIRKIDVHAHIFEEIPALVDMLHKNNASIVNVCNRGRDGSLEKMDGIVRAMYRRNPDLFPFASSFDLTRIEEPDYTNQVVVWLNRAFDNGAVMTKLWKEVGMEVRRKDGSFVLPDDPIFAPVYELLVKRGKPLMAHVADPIDGWRPLDPASPHYSYFAHNPQFHFYDKPGYPTHAQIIAARDHVLEKYPRLIVIGAHLGSLEHDLDAVAQRLDLYPNFNVDCAARTPDLARLDRAKVRDFFAKYRDRILYGVDMTWKPFAQKNPPTDAQRATFVKNLETRYRKDYEFYSQTLALPNEVLQRFFHENAERLIINHNRAQK